MAVQAKDGSRHHSASRARLHDEMSAKSGSAVTPIKKDSSDAGPGGMTHPAPTATPIQEHVDEHGPAHSVTYQHDEAGGKHIVTSYHGDAKMPGGQGGEAQDGEGGGEEPMGEKHMDHPGVHVSHHKTSHAAHAHMKHAMGMSHEEEEENEEPDSHAEPDGDENGASGIPGL